MDKLVFDETRKIWSEIGQHKKPEAITLEIEIYKKLLNVFQVGNYYYLIFNPPEAKIEYVSPSITGILGYTPQEFTLEQLMRAIHPDDLPHFVNFEVTVTRFWKELPQEKVMKYKSRYDYRVQKKNGGYLRILQQIVTIQSDDEGAVLRTFVVHTDITHLKKSNKMTLSFIGLEGEPSYYDVRPVQKLQPSTNILTPREMEILLLVAQNYTSKDIALKLHISAGTVATHRKNIYRKTKTSSVLELVQLALSRGWM